MTKRTNDEQEAVKVQAELTGAEDAAEMGKAIGETNGDLMGEIAALRAENAKLRKASAKAEKAASVQATEDNGADPMRRVRIKLFKDNERYKDPLYVSVNGYNAYIQRGVAVDVPYYVAKHIEECLAQDQNTASLIERFAGEFEARSDQL